MTEASQPTPDSPANNMTKPASRAQEVLRGCLVVFLVPILFCVILGRYAEDVVFGWLTFPLAVGSRITIDPPAIAVGGIYFVGLAIAVHVTGRWVVSWWPGEWCRGKQWSVRHMLLAVAMMVLMFALGVALVGATHQVIWLQQGRPAPSLIGDQSPPPLLPIAWGRYRARQSELKFNLKDVGMPISMYQETFKHNIVGRTESPTGEPLHGWAIQTMGGFSTVLAPHELDRSKPWNSDENAPYFKCVVPYLINPLMPGRLFDDGGFGLNHFAANQHLFGTYRYTEDEPQRHIPKGTPTQDLMKEGGSNKIWIGTARGNFKPWGSPDGLRDPLLGINRSEDGFGGDPASAGAMMLMGDGSVREINANVDFEVLKALSR